MTSTRSTAEIGSLLDRYLVGLDDEKLDDDWAKRLFTDDAVVEFPMSRHEGIDGLAAYHRSALAAFERTQHLGSPAVVELDGERARLRANLISTHVHLPDQALPDGELPPLFATGTFVTGEARRTSEGWRLSLLSFRLIWATGNPPAPRT
ncbi:nuclear transport factor 2 family protein [Streptomyces sp.]|uniref:nuclear transport factor 2 family protein n=1 Tax=Streptomyces sp. TaxID=1931 RepID=UPI002D7910F5|nr:nuclear transport factor 2 family protein [Streptomyces sp.]HET6358282.1 nuclear transport factor 2 family protein [Streptomyces sp.]